MRCLPATITPATTAPLPMQAGEAAAGLAAVPAARLPQHYHIDAAFLLLSSPLLLLSLPLLLGRLLQIPVGCCCCRRCLAAGLQQAGLGLPQAACTASRTVSTAPACRDQLAVQGRRGVGRYLQADVATAAL